MDRFGLSVALLTPFRASGEIDIVRLVSHVRGLLANGAQSVTLFGTTGEGASVAWSERMAALDAVLTGGIAADRVVMTIWANAAHEAMEQATACRARGVADFLLLPPFYFKGVSDRGLFDWHAEVLTRTDPGARFVLYHIPQVSGVPLSVDLVGRLGALGGTRVRAVKDSSGSWDNAAALLALGSVPVLVGDERLLHRAVARGGAGAISGVANLHPARMRRIVDGGGEDAALSAEVDRIVSVPVIPALKTLIAAQTGERGWEHLRPPLMPLEPAAREALVARAAEVQDG